MPWSDDVKRHWSRVREEFIKRHVDCITGELLKGISTDTDVFSRTFMGDPPSSAHAIQAQKKSTMVPYTTNSYSAQIMNVSDSVTQDPHNAFNEYRESLGSATQP